MRRAWPSAIALLALGQWQCSAPPPCHPPLDSISHLAAALTDSLSRRTDLHHVRLCVHAFQEAPPSAQAGFHQTRGRDPRIIGAELMREFTVVLSEALHVLEVELTKANAPALEDGVEPVAEHFRATHLLVGDFLRGPDHTLSVSARIVEAESFLIAAAARGVVRLQTSVDIATRGGS